MSFDVMVFEESAAPRTREEFTQWYDEQTQWKEDHGYTDPSVASPALQKFLKAFLEVYAHVDDYDESKGTDKYYLDYSVGKNIIYICFSWGHGAEICEDIEDIAYKTGVGVFTCSSACEAIFSDGTVIYDCFIE